MNYEDKYWWRIALELALRRSNGDSFQELFSCLMAKKHGDDFIRVRPFGQLGDKGCDGYVMSTGQFFQCYGALDSKGGAVATLIAKIKSDFAKAIKNFPTIIKEWHFVHNLVSGVPSEALAAIMEMKEKHPQYIIAMMGVQGFEERLFSLTDEQITDLLGTPPLAIHMENPHLDVIRDLIAAITAPHFADTEVTSIKPVPTEKLVFNNLPISWNKFISGGWANARIVEQYIDRHPTPLIGATLAQIFHKKYQELKLQKLEPDQIMISLYEFVLTESNPPPTVIVAAQAILTYLFESCDIFEEKPAAALA